MELKEELLDQKNIQGLNNQNMKKSSQNIIMTAQWN